MMLSDYLIGMFQYFSLEFNEKESLISMTNGGEVLKKSKGQDQAFSLMSPQDEQHDIGNAAFRIKDVFAFFKNRFNFMINFNFKPKESVLKYVVNPSEQPFNYFNDTVRKPI